MLTHVGWKRCEHGFVAWGPTDVCVCVCVCVCVTGRAEPPIPQCWLYQHPAIWQYASMPWPEKGLSVGVVRVVDVLGLPSPGGPKTLHSSDLVFTPGVSKVRF